LGEDRKREKACAESLEEEMMAANGAWTVANGTS